MDPDLIKQATYYGMLLIAVLSALTVHEFAHAWTALKFGDPTARDAGRVSLNPLVHIDPLGLMCLFFAGFGWAKPTPVAVHRLNHPRADLLVSAAGPVSNFAFAALAAFVLRFSPFVDVLHTTGLLNGAQLFGLILVHLNISLGFFNFLPIGPLDGSHVVRNLLPAPLAGAFARFNHAYGSLLLLGLILIGRASRVDFISILLDKPIAYFTTMLIKGSFP